jgi:hypothetical protein
MGLMKIRAPFKIIASVWASFSIFAEIFAKSQPGQAGTKKAKAHAKTQRRKVTAKFFSFAFLCATFAALRLCVNAFK